jgi:hypothetical protein
LTLPASPYVGAQVAFADCEGYFATNNLTILGNGKNIQGYAEDLICDVNGMAQTLMFSGDAQGWIFWPYTDESAGVSMPLGYIDGLILSNNTGDAAHDIDISPGEVRSITNDADIILISSLTKRIDAAWAEGTGEGGMDSGAVAPSSWYHVFLIKRTDNGTVDALFSASPDSPVMPADYNCKQRIMSVKTDGSSNIIPFHQSGDWVTWDNAVTDVGAVAGPANELVTLPSVPTGIAVRARIRIKAVSATVEDEYSAREPNVTTGSQAYVITQVANVAVWSSEVPVLTNTSAQVIHNATDAAVTCSLVVNGWIDPRGMNAT